MNAFLFIVGMFVLFFLLVPLLILVLPLLGVKGFILICIVLLTGFVIEWIGKYVKFSK